MCQFDMQELTYLIPGALNVKGVQTNTVARRYDGTTTDFTSGITNGFLFTFGASTVSSTSYAWYSHISDTYIGQITESDIEGLAFGFEHDPS